MTTEQHQVTDRVVVGIDGSAASKHALVWAEYLARTMDCKLEAVSVWQIPVAWGMTGAPVSLDDWDPTADAEECVRDAVAEVFEGRPIPVEIVAREGTAAHVLLDVSRDARILVVGSRGHGGFTGLLLGSVSSACAEHSVCPVLVVHGNTPPPPA